MKGTMTTHPSTGPWIKADGAYFTHEANATPSLPCPLCPSILDTEPDTHGQVLCRSSHRFIIHRADGVLSVWNTARLQPIDPPVVYADEEVTCPACGSSVPILDGTYSDVYYDCPTCRQELAVYATQGGAEAFFAAEDDPFL